MTREHEENIPICFGNVKNSLFDRIGMGINSEITKPISIK